MNWFAEEPSPSQEKYDYDRAWLILSGMGNLRNLSVELIVSSFPPPFLTQPIEEAIFVQPWKVELPEKWDLVTAWHLGDDADIDGAPFLVTRRPLVISDGNCWY